MDESQKKIKYYYGLSPNAFYSSEFAGTITANGKKTEDLVEISEKEYRSFFNPPDGYYLVFDATGPRLEVVPAQDFKAKAVSQRDALYSAACSVISPWQTKLLAGKTLTDDQKTSLDAWLDYMDKLEALDFSKISDEAEYKSIKWPVTPDKQGS